MFIQSIIIKADQIPKGAHIIEENGNSYISASSFFQTITIYLNKKRINKDERHGINDGLTNIFNQVPEDNFPYQRVTFDIVYNDSQDHEQNDIGQDDTGQSTMVGDAGKKKNGNKKHDKYLGKKLHDAWQKQKEKKKKVTFPSFELWLVTSTPETPETAKALVSVFNDADEANNDYDEANQWKKKKIITITYTITEIDLYESNTKMTITYEERINKLRNIQNDIEALLKTLLNVDIILEVGDVDWFGADHRFLIDRSTIPGIPKGPKVERGFNPNDDSHKALVPKLRF